jgi:hypothetical protein
MDLNVYPPNIDRKRMRLVTGGTETLVVRVAAIAVEQRVKEENAGGVLGREPTWHIASRPSRADRALLLEREPAGGVWERRCGNRMWNEFRVTAEQE